MVTFDHKFLIIFAVMHFLQKLRDGIKGHKSIKSSPVAKKDKDKNIKGNEKMSKE